MVIIMTRKKLREKALLIIYEADMKQESAREVLALNYNLKPYDENDILYLDDVVCGVFENRERLDERIVGAMENWKLDRISKISLAAMRLALYEMEFRDDVPVGAAINEAVDLTKIYDGEDAASFVNGILGKLSR